MDTQIRVSRFEDGSAAQAFPMGGRTALLLVSAAVLTPVGAAVSDAGSLFMLHVPVDRIVRYGIGHQVDALTLADARTIMYPLSSGDWLFTLSNAAQAAVRLLADGPDTAACHVMEAAVLGGSA